MQSELCNNSTTAAQFWKGMGFSKIQKQIPVKNKVLPTRIMNSTKPYLISVAQLLVFLVFLISISFFAAFKAIYNLYDLHEICSCYLLTPGRAVWRVYKLLEIWPIVLRLIGMSWDEFWSRKDLRALIDRGKIRSSIHWTYQYVTDKKLWNYIQS